MVVKLDDKLKEMLVNEGILTLRQISEAEKEQERKGLPLKQILIDLGYVSEATLAEFFAKRRGYTYVDLLNYSVNKGVTSIVSEEVARRYTIIPIDIKEDKLVVAMADPSNVFVVDDLRILTGYDIKPVVSTEADIITAIGRCYKMEKEAEEKIAETTKFTERAEEEAAEGPIIKLVNLIITRAIRDKASDIHIEPQEKDLRVRYRTDGVLHEVMRSPKRIQPAVISRFKIMSGLDVAESRKPQDGHTSLTLSGKSYDFRVATLPTVHGERVVLRILEKESILLRLEDLGFLSEDLEKFRSAFTKPYGAILITGPTGSGKSTTLYATLNVLNTEEVNIITVEDPVEYRLPGINQIQVNPKAGLTFARGLRSLLRASPDIVMVGEIRDKETAQIAIESALTGHLVFSTLHTNDAPSAISRLIEMGIEPFLVASAIDCIQAQRLARRLCKHCKEAYKPSMEVLNSINFPLKEKEGIPIFYKAKGCVRCNNTGYKGRVGIYEVLLMSETIRKLTIEEVSAAEINKVALAEGMKTLKQDALEKVALGITSVEEVFRVVV